MERTIRGLVKGIIAPSGRGQMDAPHALSERNRETAMHFGLCVPHRENAAEGEGASASAPVRGIESQASREMRSPTRGGQPPFLCSHNRQVKTCRDGIKLRAIYSGDETPNQVFSGGMVDASLPGFAARHVPSWHPRFRAEGHRGLVAVGSGLHPIAISNSRSLGDPGIELSDCGSGVVACPSD